MEAATGNARISLHSALAFLGAQQITSVMIEAGAQVNTSALQEDIVDRLDIFYGPKFLGAAGVPFLYAASADLPTIQRVKVRKVGDDFALEGWLHDPWDAPPSE